MQEKRNNPNSTKSNEHNKAEDIFSIDKDQVLNKAQTIINSAVNVLEEEIAAGILAAKKIEKKLIDVEDIRSNPDDLINRIRRDTHEAVDLVMDMFAAIINQMNAVLESVKKDTVEATKASVKFTKSQYDEVLLLEPDANLKPGDTTIIVFSLHDDENVKTNKYALKRSDFIGPHEQKILIRAIQIKPIKGTLNPGEEKEIKVHIKVPMKTSAGIYNSLLTDAYNASIRIIITINIVM